jgi:two-component system sensor histidine kinase ChvG
MKPFKSLSSRLLLFNLLILFLPMGSILFLDTFENQLLVSQENTMIQQGRIFASALSGGSDLAEDALRILTNLRGRTDSRIRVINAEGLLVADSAVLAPATESADDAALQNLPAREPPNTNMLYRFAVFPVNVLKKLLFPPPAGYSSADFYSGKRTLLGPEVESALEGRYGAATRFSGGGQTSVTLYSAIPVLSAEGVGGAVLVSRSSYGILINLYQLRFDIIKIFLVSLAFSLALSLILSFTITRPVKKLKAEAEGVLDKQGRFSRHFTGLKRKDEIGDLSRSLKELSEKLEKRIGFIDRFTSDLLHELKNPLAAIRGQTELALNSPGREEKLLNGIMAEEGRMERLLARLGELSRIDNAIDQEKTEAVDMAVFIPLLLERYNGAALFETGEQKAAVPANPDRLIQALCNPVDNALSFSPSGKKVRIRLEREDAKKDALFWRITIDDDGPGIRETAGKTKDPAGERYFERFYSERPEGEKPRHSGLGLAIVKTIIESYGGACMLVNRKDSEGRVEGGRFVIRLPGC